MTTKQFLLADVGSDAIGQTKTFVSLSPNHSPKGSYTVQVSTTYSKAKDPDAHQIKLSLLVADKHRLKDLALFLVSAADLIPIND